MRKLLFIGVTVLSVQILNGQASRNYILEINGDTLHIALDELLNFKAPGGQNYKVKLTKKGSFEFYQ